MTAIGETLAMRDAAELLGELDEEPARLFAACCEALGPAAIVALRPLLDSESETPGYVRARAIVRGYGAAAVRALSAMVDDSRWYVHRNAAVLLGMTRSADAVPPLQVLLRRNDPRVLRAAVAALAAIDDPSAARAIQTVLRAASGPGRAAVLEALVAGRDPRVIPMLARILAESDPFGADHQTVLDALGAVRELPDERAIAPVVSLMRKRRLFARRKSRAFKHASVEALCAIGTPKARQAFEDAGKTGDRLLRKIVRNTIGGSPQP
jgi:HEAT repeat protein